MSATILELLYKGERQYVHGTDILTALIGSLGSKNGFVAEATFRRPLRSLPIVEERSDLAQDHDSACSITWKAEPGPYRFFDLRESGKPIDGRYSYDEGLIIERFSYDEVSGSGHGYPEFSFIENAVAMTKAVNVMRHQPVQGQWLFSRARFSGAIPASWFEISVTSKTIASERVSNNIIEVDGRVVGSFLFMVGHL